MTNGSTPVGAVREYLGHIAGHDLASLRVCSQPYPDGYHELLIGGIFEPVGALPGSDAARTLALIEFDTSRLTIVESSRAGAQAEVEIDGVLVSNGSDPARSRRGTEPTPRRPASRSSPSC